jgi:hypothetical protein
VNKFIKWAARFLAEKSNVPRPEGYVHLMTDKNPKTQKTYRRSLVTEANHKTKKGEAHGYLTGIVHLAPAESAGAGNVCPYSTPQCRKLCLNTSGMGNMPTHQDARKKRTQLYFSDQEKFIDSLRYDIERILRKAKRTGMKPAFRINGTSDIPKLAQMMAKEYPEVQFYDYTKIPRPWQRQLPNYHLTFSRSENNDHHAKEALANGVNVAVVFSAKKGEPLPTTWWGYPVIDGDLHDLRFLDSRENDGKPVIVGLRGKGRARKKQEQSDGFVVDADKLHQIQIASSWKSPILKAAALDVDLHEINHEDNPICMCGHCWYEHDERGECDICGDACQFFVARDTTTNTDTSG